MSIKEFRLDRKSVGAQALEGLWGPGPRGDLLYDMSAKGMGKGNHATRTGTGPRTQMSDRGRVLLFNGVDDVWTTEFALGINTEAFTLCAWILLDSTVPTSAASMIGSGDGGAGEFMFRVSNSDVANARLSFYGNIGGISVSGGLGQFNAWKDIWVHAAVTRDAAGLSVLYQNGLLVSTDAAAADNLNTVELMTIGAADAHPTRWWKGMIDDVRYYSRALSLGQIAHIYESTRWTPYADITTTRIRRFGRHHWGHVRKAKGS